MKTRKCQNLINTKNLIKHYLLFIQILSRKINRSRNNTESSPTTKLGDPIPSGFLMSTISSF